MGQRRRMPRFGLSKCWFTKKSKPEDMACSELAVLSSETRQQPEHQFQGPPSKWKKHWRSAGRKFRRREEPEEASHLEETSIDFPQLVQEGQFREACLSIFSSAQDGQDCSSQYQFVAQSMWQVVQQALRDGRHSKELMQKLQSVKDAVEWARGTLQDTEDRALCDSGVAAWGCQLERLLRSDAEAHVPTWDPRNQLEPYLEDLNKAVDQWLGPQGERQLGSLKCVYKACFQEVLLSRLSQVLSSSDHQESCYRLYTWGQTALFGQRRETPQGTPGPSQKPEAESLLNQLVFVTWMSEVQKKLVELIQEALTKHLEKVMICEWENWDTSPYHTFLELLPLLEETVNSVQHAGPPVTSQVQAMVLKQFLKFLERYHARATSFLQNKGAKTFLGMRVLQNCHILRETWWELSQEYAASASLDPAVPDTIDVIEGRGRCHLLSTVRALCQVTPLPPPSWPGSFLLLGGSPCCMPQAPAQPGRALSEVTQLSLLPSLGQSPSIRRESGRVCVLLARGRGHLPRAGRGLASKAWLQPATSSRGPLPGQGRGPHLHPSVALARPAPSARPAEA